MQYYKAYEMRLKVHFPLKQTGKGLVISAAKRRLRENLTILYQLFWAVLRSQGYLQHYGALQD